MRSDLRRYHGVSLGQMFSGEITPDEIWDYVLGLPRESATAAAVYADPDTVPGGGPAEVSLREFSPEVEALTDLYDLTAALLACVSAFTSKTPVRVEPRRRPGEARREQAKAELREQARQAWAGMLGQLGIPA